MVRVHACLVATALLVAPVGAQDGSAEHDLEQARILVHKGLLKAAQALLEPLCEKAGSGVSEASLAHACLLLGNIAFERGDHAAAQACYALVLENPEGSAGMKQAARSNAERSRALQQRAQDLAGAARRLAVAVGVSALVGVVVCAWLARRARDLETTTGPA
ncbi:MAG: hypothetical protein ACYTG2_04835 [Planctomycetota bacterium]|jgi:hypothetical protein